MKSSDHSENKDKEKITGQKTNSASSATTVPSSDDKSKLEYKLAPLLSLDPTQMPYVSIDTTQSLYKIAYTAQEKKDWAKAKECFERILVVDSKHTPSLIRMGMIEKELGETTEALKHFILATEHSPKKYEIVGQDAVLRGFLEVVDLYINELAAYSDAIEILEEALQKFPSDDSLLFYLGWAQLYRGDYLDAALSFDQARASATFEDRIVDNLYKGLALLFANKTGEFEKIFILSNYNLEAIKSEVNKNYVNLGIGLYYFKINNQEKAKKHFKDAFNTSDTRIQRELFLIQGIGYRTFGNLKLALNCFRKIEKTNWPPALFHMGLAYMDSGEYLEARRCLEAAWNLFPNNRAIERVLASRHFTISAVEDDSEIKEASSLPGFFMPIRTYDKLMKKATQSLTQLFESLLKKVQDESQKKILRVDYLTAAEREFNQAVINELVANNRILERQLYQYRAASGSTSSSMTTQAALAGTVAFYRQENALLFTANRQLRRALQLFQYHIPELNRSREQKMQAILADELKPLKDHAARFNREIIQTYYEDPDKHLLRKKEEWMKQYEMLKSVILKLQADHEMRGLLSQKMDDEKKGSSWSSSPQWWESMGSHSTQPKAADRKKEKKEEKAGGTANEMDEILALAEGVRMIEELKPALKASHLSQERLQGRLQYQEEEFKMREIFLQDEQSIWIARLKNLLQLADHHSIQEIERDKSEIDRQKFLLFTTDFSEDFKASRDFKEMPKDYASRNDSQYPAHASPIYTQFRIIIDKIESAFLLQKAKYLKLEKINQKLEEKIVELSTQSPQTKSSSSSSSSASASMMPVLTIVKHQYNPEEKKSIIGKLESLTGLTGWKTYKDNGSTVVLLTMDLEQKPLANQIVLALAKTQALKASLKKEPGTNKPVIQLTAIEIHKLLAVPVDNRRTFLLPDGGWATNIKKQFQF